VKLRWCDVWKPFENFFQTHARFVVTHQGLHRGARSIYSGKLSSRKAVSL
jgi:hypothetical protein